jgi:hypothetical protein
MRKPRKKRGENTERVRNKTEALKEDAPIGKDQGQPYDDEATKELDMVLILSEAMI